MRIIRQGDVWLYEIDENEAHPMKLSPRNWKRVVEPNGHTLLALGEVTGHAHRIESEQAKQFASLVGSFTKREFRTEEINPSVRRVLVVEGDEPVALTHEEHDTLMIPPGEWEVRIQREYEPQAVGNTRLVYD